MFEQLINNMPPDPSGVVITLVVAVGVGLGALTALLGALHSRPTMSLLMLCIGAILGHMLPVWMSWHINRSAAITAGAIVFGLSGFILHRFCVAMVLGFLVAIVAAFILYDQTQPIDKAPSAEVKLQSSLAGSFIDTWDGATPKFRKAAPWVGISAFAIAGVLALALPKFGMAVLYSLGGTLLTLFSIKLGHASDKIHWLDSIKTGPMTIAVLGMTMLLVGFLTQMALLYRPESAQPKPSEADAQPASWR